MSRYKDQTEDTPPSSSGESTEERALPSSPSANTDNTQTYMQTTRTPLPNMLSSDKGGSTTLDNTQSVTTPKITEKSRQTAVVVRVALKVLLNAGLIKRYEVRSNDLTTVLRIRYEFDMSLWTESLELK